MWICVVQYGVVCHDSLGCGMVRANVVDVVRWGVWYGGVW